MIFQVEIKPVLGRILLLKDITLRQLKAKYAGTALGFFWLFIQPLLLAWMIGFVFTEIIQINLRNFYLVIIAGFLPWSFFANALQEATTSFTAQAPLMKQFSFPRAFIPLSVVLVHFASLLTGFLITLPLFLFFNPSLAGRLPALFLLLLSHLVFTMGFALILSCLHVRFRDLGQVTGILLMFWLWLTPVFYTLEMIPPRYALFFRLNPMTAFIVLYRRLMTESVFSGSSLILKSVLISVSVLGVGCWVFRRESTLMLKHL